VLTISDNEFNIISECMYRYAGINLGSAKKLLVVSRLRKRLDELKLSNFKEYVQMLAQPGTHEIDCLINRITTNESYFFRHTRQFNFLYELLLPVMAERRELTRSSAEVKIWSAACAAGEEAYSIAISCLEFQKSYPKIRFKILATDINTEVLQRAKKALYFKESLGEFPESLRNRYFKPIVIESRFSSKTLYQLDSKIMQMVQFSQHNLMEPFPEKYMDIIFLRNVLIYFGRETKQRVVNMLQDNLISGGYLFVSFAETFNDVQCSLRTIHQGIYKKS
jgi:chemotaxis protein methyltransferase CheR